MKLLDIMKKYDRCLVRESAKLTKIYNMLLREAVEEDLDVTEIDLDEEKCPDCGKDPCVCDEEEDKECDECGLIPEDDFIVDDEVKENDMLRNRPHNGHIDDPAGVIPESEFFSEAEKEECKDKECNEDDDTDDKDEEMMSAAEFFAEAEKEQKKEDEDDMIPESEFFAEGGDESDFQDAEEFFSDAETKVPEKKPAKVEETEDIDEEIEIDPKDTFVSAKELLEKEDETELDTEEQKLEESLRSYRRKNHHLFNG